MSLKVWLPLNGNLNNKGISNVAVTNYGATVSNDGKLGKCYTFNGSSDYVKIELPSDITSLVNTSTAMWVKGNRSFGGISHNTSSSLACCTFHTSWQFVNAARNNWLYINGGNPTDGNWHHICCTINETTISTYLDSILITEADTSSIATKLSSSNFLEIGCDHPGGDEYGTCSVNDFRIYNHCLTEREIKDIANGLIIHYPLNGINDLGANPNLLTWDKDRTKYKPLVHTSSAKDGINIFTSSLVNVTPGKVYYIQVKSDGILATHGSTAGIVTRNFTLWLYVRNIGTTKAVGGYDSPINLYIDNLYYSDPTTNLYVWKWTAPSNAQDIVLRTNSYSDGTTAVTINFWDFKIEESTFTQYIPGINQPEYSRLGLNSTRVADCSGLGNDGVYKGTITNYPDSPRHSNSVQITNGGVVGPLNNPIKPSKLSISGWVYLTSLPSSGEPAVLNCYEAGGAGLTVYAPGRARMQVYVSGWKYIESDILPTNTWLFLCGTYDGSSAKIYVNGELKGTLAISGTLTYHNTAPWSVCLNPDANGNGGVTFPGYLSDVRLYGTALSADEIYNLYKAPAKFLKGGQAWTSGNFSEISNKASILKNGFKFPYYTELFGKYDSRVIIEKDGSVFMRVAHHNNPASKLFASNDTFATWVYKDSDRWLIGKIHDYVDSWEYILEQQETSTSVKQRFRWKQTVNPNVATFDETKSSLVTKYTSSDGYTDISSSYGGMYKKNTSGTSYYVCNNNSSSNWFGAVGAFYYWNNTADRVDIPGYNGVGISTGYLDLYIRIDNVTWNAPKNDKQSIFKSDNSLSCSEIMEA